MMMLERLMLDTDIVIRKHYPMDDIALFDLPD
jgi:hypothetical protein